MTSSYSVPNGSPPATPARPGTDVATEWSSGTLCPAESYPTPVQPSHDPVRRLAEGLTLICWSTLIVSCGAGVMTIVAAHRALGRYSLAPVLRRLQARARQAHGHCVLQAGTAGATALPSTLVRPQTPPAPARRPSTPRETSVPHELLARIA